MAENTNTSKTYKGNCHCGAVKYDVEVSPPIEEQEVAVCNCSVCSRNGYLLVFVPKTSLSITKGEDELKTYLFGGRKYDHQSCRTCSSNLFIRPTDPSAEPFFQALNVRMIRDLDTDALRTKKVDGKSFPPEYDV